MKKSKIFANEIELILKAQQGDIHSRNQIIEKNLKLIEKIAQKSIQTSTLTKSDLVQEGIFGLLTALEKYNPSLGFKFSTYALWWIRQAMFKAISQQSYAYNIPVYVQETLSRFNKTKQEMERIEQKEVSVKEVADKLSISQEKIDTFLNAYTRALSLESAVVLSGNKEMSFADIIEDEKQNVENTVCALELKSQIKNALENLKEKEKTVIISRFGLEDNDKKTLEEIGNSFGVTKECIRQIEKRALNKLALYFSDCSCA